MCTGGSTSDGITWPPASSWLGKMCVCVCVVLVAIKRLPSFWLETELRLKDLLFESDVLLFVCRFPLRLLLVLVPLLLLFSRCHVFTVHNLSVRLPETCIFFLKKCEIGACKTWKKSEKQVKMSQCKESSWNMVEMLFLCWESVLVCKKKQKEFQLKVESFESI